GGGGAAASCAASGRALAVSRIRLIAEARRVNSMSFSLRGTNHEASVSTASLSTQSSTLAGTGRSRISSSVYHPWSAASSAAIASHDASAATRKTETKKWLSTSPSSPPVLRS